MQQMSRVAFEAKSARRRAMAQAVRVFAMLACHSLGQSEVTILYLCLIN